MNAHLQACSGGLGTLLSFLKLLLSFCRILPGLLGTRLLGIQIHPEKGCIRNEARTVSRLTHACTLLLLVIFQGHSQYMEYDATVSTAEHGIQAKYVTGGNWKLDIDQARIPDSNSS